MKRIIFYDSFKATCFFLIITLALLSGCQKTIKEDKTMPDRLMKSGLSKSKSNHLSTDVIRDWYKLQLRIIIKATPAYSNPVTIRLFAYTGVSLYETDRFSMHHSASLSNILYQMPAMPAREEDKEYSLLESANSNLAFITRKLFPTLSLQSSAAIDSLENAYNLKLGLTMDPIVFNRSQIFGRSIAQAVFNWALTDKFNLIGAPYTPPVFPGAWQPTPVAFAIAAAPYFGNVRPFLASHASGLAPVPLFSYSELPSSDFYKMVKDIYDVSQSLTTDQKNIALFWNDVGAGVGYTPSGHAISILLQVLENEHTVFSRTVEAFARAGMGMWDASIMCWRSKFAYSRIRPVTYIRNVIDPTWLPLIPTPPHPEYPAAHAYITTSTMVAIAGALGDRHTVTDHTYDFLGFPSRSFTSLFAVGVQSGMSRRYGGIHYLPSIETGIELGQSVGREVADIELGENDDEDTHD